jgi:hypothetical protein
VNLISFRLVWGAFRCSNSVRLRIQLRLGISGRGAANTCGPPAMEKDWLGVPDSDFSVAGMDGPAVRPAKDQRREAVRPAGML